MLKHNADINSRVYTGASPLSIAIEGHGEDHPFTKYLTGLGAKFMDNDLEHDDDDPDWEDDEDEEDDDDEEGNEDEKQEDDDDPEEKDEKEL